MKNVLFEEERKEEKIAGLEGQSMSRDVKYAKRLVKRLCIMVKLDEMHM